MYNMRKIEKCYRFFSLQNGSKTFFFFFFWNIDIIVHSVQIATDCLPFVAAHFADRADGAVCHHRSTIEASAESATN